MSDFLASVTTPALLGRLQEIEAERPDVRVALYMLSHNRRPEWIHSIAAASDEPTRRLLPPLPPTALRSIVSASEDEVFLWTGAVDLSNLLQLYEQYAASRPAKPRVFDFGCGCGRLTRFLHLSDRYEATASDANPDHVRWCAANLRNVRTLANEFKPPLALAASSMDFVYSLSVFTHLSLEVSTAWLAELARITTSGGIIAITTHGYPALDIIASSAVHQSMFSLTAEQAREMKRVLPERGHIYLPYDATTLVIANLGSSYGNGFLDASVGQLSAPGLEQIDCLPGGLRGWQDIIVFRKR